jgi:hypothetical protein
MYKVFILCKEFIRLGRMGACMVKINTRFHQG